MTETTIQIKMNENQNEKVEHYKISKKLNTKEEAILGIIDDLNLEIQLPKVKKVKKNGEITVK